MRKFADGTTHAESKGCTGERTEGAQEGGLDESHDKSTYKPRDGPSENEGRLSIPQSEHEVEPAEEQGSCDGYSYERANEAEPGHRANLPSKASGLAAQCVNYSIVRTHDTTPLMPPQPVGNVFDKYASRNLVVRHLMNGFFRAVGDFYEEVGAASVLEVGCGEGRLAQRLLARGQRPQRFELTDVSLARLDSALDPLFVAKEASVYALPYDRGAFDLVVCCEVLEHLEHPKQALAEIARVARGYVLLSTPREPLWRAMNLARGRYIASFGNTPGHLQHWSRRSLLALVSQYVRVEKVAAPLPWTVVLARPHPTHSNAYTSPGGAPVV